jgi:subtilisin family serine protease
MRKLWQLALTFVPSLVLIGVLFAINPAYAGPTAPNGLPRPRVFIKDRVLVTGTYTDILVMGDIFGSSISQTSLTDLSFLSGLPVGANNPIFFRPNELRALRMATFKIKTGEDPQAVIKRLGASPAFSRTIPALDYVTAHNEWGTISNPKWIIVGSPLTVTASDAITLYRHQFTQLGVYGMGPFAFSERPLPVTGKDVPVAIFDTSPFSLPDNLPSLQNIHGASISVTHMTLPISTGLTSTVAISGHGTFVAGLIQALAPDAKLHLYRVLGDDGLGTESALIQALSAFSSNVKSKSVINLSLTILAHPTETVEPLNTVLTGLALMNNTLVAASGNDATSTITQPMRLPAAYPFVMGVASANTAGHRSCFSNVGRIGAPGGEGDTKGGGCNVPASYTCAGDNMCLLTSWWQPTVAPTMTFGAGTSFAAPFVSAAAALTIEDFQIKGTPVTSDSVQKFIYDNAIPREAELGHGILNLGNMFLPKRSYLPIAVKQ